MNTSTGVQRVAIYARISEDATGEAAGVDRQLVDARELAASRGWTVVAEHSDNDISALTGKHRPGYEEILRLVEGGKVDHVIVWQTSRLLRNRKERAAAIELFAKMRVGIMTVKGQDLDLSTAYGRGMAGLLGEFDTMESEVKSERVAAAAFDRARKGMPNGSLGYGWHRGADGEYLEQTEQADVVREMTRRLLAGESLLGLTADLNARQIPAPNSATWGKTSVKKIALRPSNAALRIHHQGKASEQTFDGQWPAIVKRADWERLTARLTLPDRQTNGAARPGARKHLLSWGIGTCGLCGSRLRVALRGSSQYGVKQRLYICDAPKSCVGRNEARVDELVGQVVVERMSRPDATDWLLGDEDEANRARARLVELQDRRNAIADKYAVGLLPLDLVIRMTEQLEPEIEAAKGDLARHVSAIDSELLSEMAGPKAAEYWEARDVTQRRAILERLGMRVTINRASRRGPGFNRSDVAIDFGAK